MNQKTLINFDQFFAHMESRSSQIWEGILSSSRFVRAINEGRATQAMYAIYMIETYHYTSHNSRNQVLVGIRPDCSTIYTKFCYEHAAEEVGHEKMALHDVASLGLPALKEEGAYLPEPLLDTECLISYLYWISITGNPLQRLGYSYWAESCYSHINPILEKLRDSLQLKASQLTFFIAHSDIDAEHFEGVKDIIRRTCKNEQDLTAISRVMENSLQLTGRMLEAVYDEYELLLAGRSERCALLRNLGA